MKKIPWKLAVLLLLSVTNLLIFGYKKEGYQIDEIYSYGLANSEYLPFMHFGEIEYGVKDWMIEYGAGESLGDLFRNVIRDFQILKECDFQWRESVIYEDYLRAQANSADTRTTTWMSGQAYKDYIAVSESNTFNYASVYYNQRGDVHPPLYYIILHTVCSIFQGMFSKWFALSINIVFLMLTLLLLYQMVKDHLGGESAALAVVGIYGLSSGFTGTAMLLRMYSMLTFMTTACCYVHLVIAADDFRLKGKNRRRLMLVVLCGYLTQYYFVLYCLVIAAVFIVWMMARRKWRQIFSYLLTLAGTAAIGLCVWPYAIRHVFDGYRGQEAIYTILYENFYMIYVKQMFGHVTAQLFGGHWALFWIFVCIGAGIVLWNIAGRIFRKIKGRGADGAKGADGMNVFSETGLPWAKGLLAVLPPLLYLMIVSQIAPYIADRYIMCTYPFWCVFAAAVIVLLTREIPRTGKADAEKAGISFRESPRKFLLSKWREGLLVLTGVVLFGVNNCLLNVPGCLELGGQDTMEVPENTDCIYVLPGGYWNESVINSTIMAQCRRVGVVYITELELLAKDYEYQTGDYVLVAVQMSMETDEELAEVREAFGLEALTELDRIPGEAAEWVLLGKPE